MSIVSISDVTVLSNPAAFTEPYRFKITFECIAALPDDLEWKLIYVGSAQSDSYDQELDTCEVGPVPVGVNSFEFEADAPSPSEIPATDLVGVTVILLTCSYRSQEFVRVGYYVNTEYSIPALKEQYDASLLEDSTVKAPDPLKNLEHIRRTVLAEKPRVTRLNINWDTTAPLQQPTQDGLVSVEQDDAGEAPPVPVPFDD